jgi:hypothetical protein
MRPDGLLLLAANRYRDREVAAGWLVRWRLRIGARAGCCLVGRGTT